MPETVIAPLDGSDFALRALPVAASLAQALDAELLLVTTPMTLDELDPSELPVWLPDAAAAIGYDRVRTELLQEHDVLTAIAGCVDAADEPVLCMPTHGRGALASNAILPTAREWARTLDRKVVVVHVANPRDGAAPSAPVVELERVVEFFEAELADDGLRVLHDRHAASGILELTDSIAATLVALSTHGHSGRARLTLGRVEGAVIHAAPCPVLITRPSELSPVP